ncbi:MAG TPA: NAD(P)-binding domain-containing protein [Chitinophagaceae bacterium]|nr:NAD(P)-binding domain-containing protein [Chitinophagaceae bacterium]
MNFGIIGSGSWATALAKILTDNQTTVHWLFRNNKSIQHILKRHHNPNYLSSVYFDTQYLKLTTDINELAKAVDAIIIAVPAAYVVHTFELLQPNILTHKKIISSVKGIIPTYNLLVNDYLKEKHCIPTHNYFTIMGPCHAEEVANEKLSYLTFSGMDEAITQQIATHFQTPYLNTITNKDIYGVQFAAVLKNIYALGAGIAHGLEYGDNFLSVLIANCANEMADFLNKAAMQYGEQGKPHTNNYASSVYLGDLLVTCYSLYSRNRTFGNMIGKGYSVKAAQLEMNMVAEGYNAAKCIHLINKKIKTNMPIVEMVYGILWEKKDAAESFSALERLLL